MSRHTLSSKVDGVRRVPAVTFLRAFAAYAMAMPLLLVVVAFSTLPGTIERAHFIVAALQWSVLGLGAALALRAMYLLAERSVELTSLGSEASHAVLRRPEPAFVA